VKEVLPLQHFTFYSAGIGVVNSASRTMARMLGNNDVAFESARSQFWIVDAHVRWITKNPLTLINLQGCLLFYPIHSYPCNWNDNLTGKNGMGTHALRKLTRSIL